MLAEYGQQAHVFIGRMRSSAIQKVSLCGLLPNLAGTPLGAGLLSLEAALGLGGQALLASAPKEGESRCPLFLFSLVILFFLQRQWVPHN